MTDLVKLAKQKGTGRLDQTSVGSTKKTQTTLKTEYVKWG